MFKSIAMLKENAWKTGALFIAYLAVGLLCLNVYLTPNTDPSQTASQNNNTTAPALTNLPGEPTTIPPEPNTTSPLLDKSDNELAADALVAGDRFSISGNCLMALQHYEKFQTLANRTDVKLRLRKAACYERIGQLRIAANEYQTVISQSPLGNHLGLAIAGLARVHITQQRANEAIQLLANHGNKIQSRNELSVGVRSQLGLQWARALENKALTSTLDGKATAKERPSYPSGVSEDLSYPTSLAVVKIAESPEAFLALVDQKTTTTPTEQKPTPVLGEARLQIKVLQRPTESAESIAVSIDSTLHPLLLILSDLETKSQLKIQLSKQAKSIVSLRSGKFNIESITLGALLDQVLVSHGLVWQQQDSVIFVTSEPESEQLGSLHQFQLASAARAFRRFELEFPEDRFRTAALMSRARLAVREGELAGAGNLYRELEQIGPKGEVLAQLFFNQAKLSLMHQQRLDAKSLLYKAVDQTLDRNLQSSSYGLLSRLHLTAGELKQAIKTGRRALVTSTTNRQKRIATLAQARAYLLSQNPFSANATLFQNSKSVKADGKHTAVASMLGAYAHSIGLSEKHKHSLLAAKIRLLTAIDAFSADPSDSFADHYIAGLAYAKNGWRKQAIQMMVLALSQPDIGQWQRQLTFELATMLKEDGQQQQATALFSQINNGEDTWRTQALYQIAQLNFDTGKTKRCVEACRTLLKIEIDDEQEAAALHLLGLAFQRQGEHHSAALCFAGMRPFN